MTEISQRTKTRNAKTQELATAAVNGVDGAFDEIVSVWAGHLYQKVKPEVEKVRGTHEDAEELVSSILFKTNNALCTWDRKSPFAATIYKITQNTVSDYYRALGDAPYIKNSDGDILYRYVSIDNPDEYVINDLADERGEELFREADIKDLREALELVIDSTLRKTQAEVIKRCIDGEEPDQIADAMKLTKSTVYHHIKNATRKLLANQSIHSMLSAFVFLGGDKGMEDIAIPAGLTAKIIENISTAEAAGAATTTAATATTVAAATTTAATSATIGGIAMTATAKIAISIAAVVIVGGGGVGVYAYQQHQEAQKAAIIEQQEQERAASEAEETARIAEETAQREREAEAARIAEEKAAAEKAASEKAEQERKAAEEQAEAERVAAELERIAAEEEAARLEAEAARLAAQQAQPAPAQPAPAPQQPAPQNPAPSQPSGGGNLPSGFGNAGETGTPGRDSGIGNIFG